jgi:hypothetical protein
VSFPSSHWLTPYKHTALVAMAEGPLDRTEDGWVSRKGSEGLWNSHTILWLSLRGYSSMNHGKTTVGITNRGRQKIGLAADYAA